ncbi:MAG: hypothetical protein MZU97_12600 [Bacillus subtilis]|nr:hypothetical protein [Bacillus subtilis]
MHRHPLRGGNLSPAPLVRSQEVRAVVTDPGGPRPRVSRIPRPAPFPRGGRAGRSGHRHRRSVRPAFLFPVPTRGP